MKDILTKRSTFFKQEAKRLGFSFAGSAKSQYLEEEARYLEDWLNRGMHGKMGYMENHFDKRVNPSLLVPGAKSVLTLMYNYHSDQKQLDPEAPKCSMYAWGEDYHIVIKNKLRELYSVMQDEFGDFEGRVFVDSAPVLERTWAARSGLGWIGKNANVINKRAGSCFFIAVMILDLEMAYDEPVMDHCGTCTACIDACPTEAIGEKFKVDGSKCISYLTIELRDEIPAEFSGKMQNWVFGCDVCQDVCPWNRFSSAHKEPAFGPNNDLLELSKSDWYEMTEEIYREIFRRSPVKRAKWAGLKKNLSFLKRS